MTIGSVFSLPAVYRNLHEKSCQDFCEKKPVFFKMADAYLCIFAGRIFKGGE